MNNSDFLLTLKKSFITCLSTSERSNAKLKILHGKISQDIFCCLNDKSYKIYSLGFGEGKEKKIRGRYVDKVVDITIEKSGKVIAGIAVKFVMSNYSQNSNNYFESMLGETANIRAEGIPYFQVFIIPDILPYYEKDGTISHWEHICEHHLTKYINLSNDDDFCYKHTPDKFLMFIIHIDSSNLKRLKTKSDFKNYFLNNDFSLSLSNLNFNFGQNIVFNDYSEFITEIITLI